MGRALVIVGLALATGCNAILGLDEPSVGTAIDAADPDGAPDSATTDDLDGDGIARAADNCPDVYNLHQDDDDSDGLGDVCDPCPQQAGAFDDADGDGIGDVCGDPTIVSAQCIVWYDGFVDGRTASLYRSNALHGAWSFAGGAVAQSDTAVDEGFLYLTAPTFTKPLVLTHGAVTGKSVITAGQSWELGPRAYAARPELAIPEGAQGQLGQKTTEPVASVIARKHVMAVADSVNSLALGRALDLDDPLLLAVDTRTGLLAATRFDDDPTTQNVGVAAVYSGPGLIGLRTHNVSARFDYLQVVVDRGTAACPVRVEP